MRTLPLILCAFSFAAAAADTAPNPSTVRLAAPGLTVVSLDKSLGEFFADHFSQALGREQQIRVITAKEVATVIGIERQKQLLGCSTDEESASCMAELAGALGVDGVITGSVAKIGDSFVANIKIVSAGDARTLATTQARGADGESFMKALAATTPEVADQLREALRRPLLLEHPLRPYAWAPAVLGTALVLGGGGLFTSAYLRDQDHRLGKPTYPSLGEARAAIDQTATHQRFGVIGVSAGAALLTAAGVMYLWGGAAVAPSVALSIEPGRTTLSFAVCFP